MTSIANSRANRIFPIVNRIRGEIDFYFSAFYGDLMLANSVCLEDLKNWVKKRVRGPEHLSIYIKGLAGHLEYPTRRTIFQNLANDAITSKKKVDPVADRSPMKRHGITFIYLIAIMLIIFILGIFAPKIFEE